MTGVLEVCVDSLDGVRSALRGGADRIELCAELGVGGLTPSAGLMRASAELMAQTPRRVELMVMIRPRAGHFQYSAAEVDCMVHDLRAARQHGAAGVVCGAATRSRGTNQLELDHAVLRTLVVHAHGLSLTCHRVIDEIADREAAFEVLDGLGFDHVLTSGGAATAIAGVEELARSVAWCAHRHLTVLVGGGVRSDNIVPLRDRTGATAFHTSASEPVADSVVDGLSAYAWPLRRTSTAMVAACRQELNR